MSPAPALAPSAARRLVAGAAAHASRAFLFLVWALVVTPLALWLRARGRQPIRRRPDRRLPTYWEPYAQDADPTSYAKQL